MEFLPGIQFNRIHWAHYGVKDVFQFSKLACLLKIKKEFILVTESTDRKNQPL